MAIQGPQNSNLTPTVQKLLQQVELPPTPKENKNSVLLSFNFHVPVCELSQCSHCYLNCQKTSAALWGSKELNFTSLFHENKYKPVISYSAGFKTKLSTLLCWLKGKWKAVYSPDVLWVDLATLIPVPL